jgi:RNA polymerase sigma-70 factor (ECF subfamily)
VNADHSKQDEELICLLKTGNESAFTEIYNRYWDKLYYIAHKLLKDTEASEEIVQEVFLVLWKKRQNLNILSLTQYLSAMTRYAVYRHIAKEKKYSKQENSENLLQTEAADEIDLDNKILLEIITKLSNKLPEKCRLVFQYNKIQDQSLQEVAQQLNITQKTAEAHLTKALRVIRANFGDVTHLGYVLISFLFLKK